MKMWNYVFSAVFLALLFQMAGLPVATSLLTFIGIDIANGAAAFESGTFWVAVIALLTASAGAGIVIGFLTKSSSENYVILPFLIAQIVFFLAPLIGIASVAAGIGGWVFYITLLIITPLLVGFGVALYEHFRGTD